MTWELRMQWAWYTLACRLLDHILDGVPPSHDVGQHDRDRQALGIPSIFD